MTGLTDLKQILQALTAELDVREYVFCSLPVQGLEQCLGLQAIAACEEAEGWSVVLPRAVAERNRLEFDGVFRRISLGVHSSLAAVGLTASISAALAAKSISANIIAGRYHDHVLVPAERADAALQAILELACD